MNINKNCYQSFVEYNYKPIKRFETIQNVFITLVILWPGLLAKNEISWILPCIIILEIVFIAIHVVYFIVSGKKSEKDNRKARFFLDSMLCVWLSIIFFLDAGCFMAMNFPQKFRLFWFLFPILVLAFVIGFYYLLKQVKRGVYNEYSKNVKRWSKINGPLIGAVFGFLFVRFFISKIDIGKIDIFVICSFFSISVLFSVVSAGNVARLYCLNKLKEEEN